MNEPTLGGFVDEYITGRKDVKPEVRTNYAAARSELVEPSTVFPPFAEPCDQSGFSHQIITTNRKHRSSCASGDFHGLSVIAFDKHSQRTIGLIGFCLADTWYDPSGRVVKSLPAGSKLFTKTKFDSLGRGVIRYSGYDLEETSYADAFSVTDDVIIEQSETTYDDANHVLQTTTRLRYHNAPDTQTGPLQDPSSTPKARVTYTAAWQDGIGRTFATANYGTNGGTALSRPSTAPASSDTVLVSLVRFDDAGEEYETVDPSGMVTRLEFDDLGRKFTEIKNYQPGSSSSSSSSSSSGDDCEVSDDTNVTTRYTFTPDGHQATLTAVNPRTTDQTTTWTYGTTLATSDIASSQLLASLAYPDSIGSSDAIQYTYNRQGEKTTLADQRGCVHTFEYDKLARQTRVCPKRLRCHLVFLQLSPTN